MSQEYMNLNLQMIKLMLDEMPESPAKVYTINKVYVVVREAYGNLIKHKIQKKNIMGTQS